MILGTKKVISLCFNASKIKCVRESVNESLKRYKGKKTAKHLLATVITCYGSYLQQSHGLPYEIYMNEIENKLRL